MRVIAGSAKGHNLKTPEGLETRPTTDRIKETLFNIIAFDLPNCDFLDLFAGSGAIGIEALSRGANRAFFVDESNICADIIEQNLAHTKLEAKGEILKKDVNTGIKDLVNRKLKFDIIFLDPPYKKKLSESVLKMIAEGGILKKDGYVIVESATKIPLEKIEGFHVIREKVYKTTVITWLSLED